MLSLCILLLAAALVLLISYICVRMVFAVHSTGRDEPKMPQGQQYLVIMDKIRALVDGAAALPYDDVYTQSFDGLRLHGKFYAVDENAPTHILFHGYRSS
ncbi:MAG: hypothetical protein IIX72_05915, partial [Oscillospiraceae bacterium]|nr:hypothetical protein [Oscillospiraceae bacterium]